MNNKNNNLYIPEDRPSRPSRPSIFAELEKVKEQVEHDCFGNFIIGKDREIKTDKYGNRITYTDPIYEEICLIIAEVNLLNPDSEIKISGSEISTFIVQEVYSKIDNDVVESVVHKFKKITTQIYNKKAYLRTALYNAIFEKESEVTNDVARTMGY